MVFSARKLFSTFIKFLFIHFEKACIILLVVLDCVFGFRSEGG